MKQQNDGSAYSLKGKKVFIIGGSSGIGLATAQVAAAEGAHIIIASSNAAKVANALTQLPEGTEGHTLDVTDEQQVIDVLGKISQIDHLVFTAGENLLLGAIDCLPVADAKLFYNTRFWGAFTVVKHAAGKISKSGSIVLCGGIAALRPQKGWSVGTSICAAMEGFTRAMAIELAPVRVNIVSPGFVRTNLWNNIPEPQREELYAATASTLPAKRIGEASDIAQSFLYLMKQPFSTGQVIIADGGHVLV